MPAPDFYQMLAKSSTKALSACVGALCLEGKLGDLDGFVEFLEQTIEKLGNGERVGWLDRVEDDGQIRRFPPQALCAWLCAKQPIALDDVSSAAALAKRAGKSDLQQTRMPIVHLLVAAVTEESDQDERAIGIADTAALPLNAEQRNYLIRVARALAALQRVYLDPCPEPASYPRQLPEQPLSHFLAASLAMLRCKDTLGEFLEISAAESAVAGAPAIGQCWTSWRTRRAPHKSVSSEFNVRAPEAALLELNPVALSRLLRCDPGGAFSKRMLHAIMRGRIEGNAVDFEARFLLKCLKRECDERREMHPDSMTETMRQLHGSLSQQDGDRLLAKLLVTALQEHTAPVDENKVAQNYDGVIDRLWEIADPGFAARLMAIEPLSVTQGPGFENTIILPDVGVIAALASKAMRPDLLQALEPTVRHLLSGEADGQLPPAGIEVNPARALIFGAMRATYLGEPGFDRFDQCLALFQAWGVDYDAKIFEDGKFAALHVIAMRVGGRDQPLALMLKLVESGCDIDNKDWRGWVPASHMYKAERERWMGVLRSHRARAEADRILKSLDSSGELGSAAKKPDPGIGRT